MRKKITKVFAMLMTMMLLVGMMSTSVFAAVDKDATGTILVTGAEAEVTVSAYRLMNVSYDGTQFVEPQYTWVNEVAAWVKTNYSTYIGEGNDSSVTEAFSNASADNVAAFYDALAAAIRKDKDPLALTSLSNVTADSEGKAKITSATMGNYLILIEGGLKVYRPSAVNVVPTWKETETQQGYFLEEVTVELKSSDVTIEKGVSDTSAVEFDNKQETLAIGDTAYFGLNVQVPTYPTNAEAKQFEISDKLSEGLTLDTNSIKVYGYNDKADEAAEIELTTGYTLTTIDAKRYGDKGAVTFHIEFTDYDVIKGYTHIRVYYNAVLNENAQVGTATENKAYLDYSNNPYDSNSWKSDDDKTEVFTYGIEVTKVDENDDVLSGAVFKLSENSNESTPITFVGTAGNYHVATEDQINDTNVVKTTELEVDSNGKLLLQGLDAETSGTKYYLTETKAPNKYVKLKTSVEITITAQTDNDGNLTGDVVEDNTTIGIVPVTVKNIKGFELPKTGGMGTVIFTASGVVIMGAALMMFVVMFRRRRA